MKTERLSNEEGRKLLAQQTGNRGPKIRANKVATVVDGEKHIFDSEMEYHRWKVLTMYETAGEIQTLRPHPIFPLGYTVDGNGLRRVARYTGDFVYHRNGSVIVEDFKGAPATELSKAKMGQAREKYPEITFVIVTDPEAPPCEPKEGE